jgi:probable F420-dependent oxidoreductase
MSNKRSFRFGVYAGPETRQELLSVACEAESLGYDIFLISDHLHQQIATFPALTTVAENTGMRIGTYVLCGSLRHPVVMAKDAATLDLLSDGRFELGLGAGYLQVDYDGSGIGFETASIRFERLAETVAIAKLAFEADTVNFEGAHYQLTGYRPYPKPTQRPRPPLLVGGGGRRVLSLAAAEADIVGIMPAAVGARGMRATQMTLKSVMEKCAWIRAAAGDRGSDLEINILVLGVIVTNDRRAAAEAHVNGLRRSPFFTFDGELTADDLLTSPYFAFGNEEEIAEHVMAIREETGASYFAVSTGHQEAFAPIMHRLSSQAVEPV